MGASAVTTRKCTRDRMLHAHAQPDAARARAVRLRIGACIARTAVGSGESQPAVLHRSVTASSSIASEPRRSRRLSQVPNC